VVALAIMFSALTISEVIKPLAIALAMFPPPRNPTFSSSAILKVLCINLCPGLLGSASLLSTGNGEWKKAVTFVFVSKQVFVQNLSHEIEFDLHEKEPVAAIHFQMNGFTRRLVWT